MKDDHRTTARFRKPNALDRVMNLFHALPYQHRTTVVLRCLCDAAKIRGSILQQKLGLALDLADTMSRDEDHRSNGRVNHGR